MLSAEERELLKTLAVEVLAQGWGRQGQVAYDRLRKAFGAVLPQWDAELKLEERRRECKHPRLMKAGKYLGFCGVCRQTVEHDGC